MTWTLILYSVLLVCYMIIIMIMDSSYQTLFTKCKQLQLETMIILSHMQNILNDYFSGLNVYSVMTCCNS